MASAHVLVSGLRGLGVEIAKNLILAGVRAVSLQDSGAVEARDLSSQFYFSANDVAENKNRAAACASRLQELNPAVKVSVVNATLEDPEFLSQFNVVVVTDCPMEKAKRLDEFCHQHQPSIGESFAIPQSRSLRLPTHAPHIHPTTFPRSPHFSWFDWRA